MTPILINHDHHKPVGRVVSNQDGKCTVEFTEDMRITREMFFEIFGNVGFHVLEGNTHDGVLVIKKATILEFSLSPAIAAQQPAP